MIDKDATGATRRDVQEVELCCDDVFSVAAARVDVVVPAAAAYHGDLWNFRRADRRTSGHSGVGVRHNH